MIRQIVCRFGDSRQQSASPSGHWIGGVGVWGTKRTQQGPGTYLKLQARASCVSSTGTSTSCVSRIISNGLRRVLALLCNLFTPTVGCNVVGLWCSGAGGGVLQLDVGLMRCQVKSDLMIAGVETTQYISRTVGRLPHAIMRGLALSRPA
jgi:hypothetical protein